MNLMSLEAKINFLAFAPCAVSPLSLIGSSLMLFIVARTRQAGTQLTTYHRLLCGIAIFDLIFSVALVFGPLPVPKDANTGYPGQHGTVGTCSLQAFFLQVGITSFAYSALLMLYFVLKIRYNLSDNFIGTKVEPVMHSVVLLYHGSIAIAAFPAHVYNPQGRICWINAAPYGCNFDPDDDFECERGEKYEEIFGLYLLTYTTMAWTFMIVICLFIVGVTVLQSHRKIRRYAFPDYPTLAELQSSRLGDSSAGDSRVRSPSSATNRSRRNTLQTQSQQVITQCLLYAFSFLNCLVWGTIGTIMYLAEVPYETVNKHFWIAALSMIFLPLQGLFNFMIYIRSRYLSVRRQYPLESRLFALRETIYYPVSSDRERIARASVTSSHLFSNSNNHALGSNGSANTSNTTSRQRLEKVSEGKEDDELTMQKLPRPFSSDFQTVDQDMTLNEGVEQGAREKPVNKVEEDEELDA